MNSKNFELNVNVRNIPEEYFPQVTERVKFAIISILQEYGAGQISCETGFRQTKNQ